MAHRSNRTKRPARPGCCESYPCRHCGTERIVGPVSMFVRFANQHPGTLPGFAFEELRPLVGDDGMVAMCPGCRCITSDLSDAHSH